MYKTEIKKSSLLKTYVVSFGFNVLSYLLFYELFIEIYLYNSINIYFKDGCYFIFVPGIKYKIKYSIFPNAFKLQNGFFLLNLRSVQSRSKIYSLCFSNCSFS